MNKKQWRTEVSLLPSENLYVLTHIPILANGKDGKRGKWQGALRFNWIEKDVQAIENWIYENGIHSELALISNLAGFPSPSLEFYNYYLALKKVEEKYENTHLRNTAR